MPKLRHFDNLGTVRFVTFGCYHRHELLTTPQVVSVFLDALDGIRVVYSIQLLGYVVMPDHVHLVLLPPNSIKLGPVIGELKSKSASQIIARELIDFPVDCFVFKDGRQRLAFWQPRCYDHNCRTNETAMEKIDYCHNNPVARGLVTEPGAWLWSSYNWYRGVSRVPIEMDKIDRGSV